MRPPVIGTIDRRAVLFEYRTSVQPRIHGMRAAVNTTVEAAGKAGPARLPEGMGGLAQGLAIIEAFSPPPPPPAGAKAAEASGPARPSARRCLLTLTELGYLEFDGKYFRPQPRLLALSAAYA